MKLLDHALPPLTVAQEVEWLKGLDSDSQVDRDKARDMLLLSNMKLINKIALELTNGEVPLEDLVMEGCIGFLHALTKYEPGHGTRLTSYARHWIEQKIRLALYKQSRVVRVPPKAKQAKAILLQAERDYTAEFGKKPSLDELAEYTGNTSEYVRKTLSSLIADRRFEASEDEEDQASLSDKISAANDEESDADNGIEDEDLKKVMLQAISKMSKLDQLILKLRYGLEGSEPCTLLQLGQEIGRVPEMCRQLQERALNKLKKTLKD